MTLLFCLLLICPGLEITCIFTRRENVGECGGVGPCQDLYTKQGVEEEEEEEEYSKERWRDAGVSSETAADLWGQRALGPLAQLKILGLSTIGEYILMKMI